MTTIDHSKSTVLFTHGTLMDSSMFDAQVAAIADTHNAVALEFRANTDQYNTEYDLNDLAEDTIAAADSLGLDKFVLAGMSMGGFMGLELALKHQDRLSGLVLIDTMARAYQPDQKVGFGEAFNPLDTDGPLPRSFGDWCVPLVFGPHTISDNTELVDKWLQRWDERPARSVYREFKSWIDKDDLTDRLHEITVPTLIVHGRQDNVLPLVDCGIPLAEGIPNNTFVIIEDSGHTSNAEQPEAVNRALVEFLATLD